MKRILLLLSAIVGINAGANAQCEIQAIATPNTIVCGESVVLSAFGTSTGSLVLDEDFNTGGFGPGWSSTPGATSFSNPCSPGGVDGTTHAWMDNNTSVPRALTSANYDLSAATAGVTICFDLLFATQGNAAPCEGPDEPDEGVFLQYSIDGGTTWIDIYYFDPNGGNDPQLTNWNNWCFSVPAAAITSNTMFQWYQEADSGADYDHWGIDNVQIFMNDINSEIVWLHDGYSYGVGNPGGDNPTPVTPTTTTTYTAQITTGTGDVCTQDVTVTVTPPVFDVNVSATPTTICDGDCSTITGTAQIIQDPGGIETYENNEFSLVASGNAAVNINVQGINTSSIYNGLIQNVTINGFDFSGSFVCTNFGGCNCNGASIGFGSTCNLDASGFEVTLTSPGGCTIILAPAGVANGNYSGTVFVPVGGSAFGPGFPGTAGPWDPQDPFSNLNGCDPNGVWTLSFDAPGLGIGIGTLFGWSITFDDPPIYQPVCTTWNPTTDLTSPGTIDTDACPTISTTYTLTVSNCVPGCPTYDEVIPITVNPCGGCTPPNMIINPLQECSPNTVDLANAIGAGSDPATLTYYSSQVDAQNATNPISSVVGASGSYWVRAEDPTDPTCFLAYEIIVTINDLSYSASVTDESCGAGDGQISLTPNLGVGPYSYSIDGGATIQGTGTFAGLSAGSYNIVITDNGTGCTATGVENVSNIGGPSIDNVAITDPTCPGACDGSITVTVSGGNPPYTYQWYDGTGAPIGTNSATISGLCPDNYQIDVSDAGGVTTQLFYDDFETGAAGWTMNVTMAPEGADPNFFQVDDDEGGVAVGGCGVAGNGNATLHVTSVFNPAGGAAYDAGGLCGLLFCPESHRQCETPLINTVGQTGLTLNFDYIAEGDIPFDQGTVWYDDGGGWTQLGGALFSGTGACFPQGIWTAYSAGLPASCENIPNLRIAIRWDNNDDGAGSDPSLAINNIEIVTAGGATCTSTQFATITDPLAADPTFVLADFCEGAANNATGILTPGGTFAYNPNPGDGSTVNASTGEITNGVVGATYTVEYTTPGACPVTSTQTVTVNGFTYSAALTDENCGLADGQIDLSTIGGAAAFTYSVDNGATTQGTGLFTGLAAGNYNILITDNNGCQATGTETLNNIGGPTITAITPTDPSCAGTCDGEITVTVTGGAAPFSFQWYDGTGAPIGPNAATLTGLCADNYSVDVTDAGGVCVVTSNTTLTDPISADPTFVLTDFCEGATNNATGIVTPGGTFAYNPNPGDGSTINGATGEITNGVQGTTYTVEYTTPGACPQTSTQTVTVTGFSYSAVVTDENCGGADGSIDLAPVGGTAAYTYSIDNGASSQGTGLFNGLTNNTYDILITDANGCQATGTEIVGNIGGPTITSITPIDPTCAGACDGEITIVVAGGTPPYSYQWYDGTGAPIGPDAATITGLCADNYSVEVTDATGGSATVLNTNSDFEAGPGGGCNCPTGYNCNNDAGQVFDGSMPVWTVGNQGCVTGATNYTNSIGANSGSGYVYFYAGADNISTGPYTFAGGEQVELCVWYSGPQGAGASGQNTANSHFSFGVDGVQVGPDVLVPTNTGWTQYCFTVTMTAGNHTFEILSGGAAQYSLWFDDFTITDISGGGGPGCPANASATITDPAADDPSFTLTDFCVGDANSATAIATPGGTFAYNPNPGDGSTVDAVTGEITNGVAGTTYTVEYTTSGACPQVATNMVTVNGFTYNAALTDETCTAANGEINLTTVGGSATFIYSIDNGTTTQAGGLFTGLSAGVYNVLITDGNGCQATGQETLIDTPSPLIDAASIVDETCMGNNDGSIDVTTVTGGSGGYDYSWNIVPDPAVANVTGLAPGNYTVTVTDQITGCTDQATYTINAGPICCDVVIDTLSTTSPSCGMTNGEIVATATGGDMNYTYSINGAAFVGSGTFQNLASGAYQIIVIDGNGCADTIDVTLNDLGAPNVDLVVSNDATCNGSLDGDITITASGGTGVLDYQIDNGAGFTDNNATGVFTGLAAGTYTITVTDQNGCQATDVVTIAEPTAIVVDVIRTDIDCFGSSNGVIDVSATGGASSYQYSIDNGTTWSASGLFNGLTAGNYNVIVEDGNGCQSPVTVVVILEPTQLVADVVATNESCFGDCNGSIIWGGQGGTPAYAFTYNGTTATGTTVSSLCPGTYNYVLTDDMGCTVNGSIDIIAAQEIVPGPITSVNDGCGDDCTGSILVESNTGVTYTMNGASNGTGFFSQLCSGIYAITITDANGCTETVGTSVGEAEPTEAHFAYNPGYVTVFENEVQLTNTSYNADSYIWEITGPNGITDAYDYDITSYEFPADSGAYMVCLIAINNTGCSDTMCAPIVVQDQFTIFVPNTFTPDGDEFNQTFMAYVNGIDDYDFDMFIFNRWGELIWESHDKTVGWDGTYNGKIVQTGTYVWRINVKDKYSDDRQTFTGHVNVLK